MGQGRHGSTVARERREETEKRSVYTQSVPIGANNARRWSAKCEPALAESDSKNQKPGQNDWTHQGLVSGRWLGAVQGRKETSVYVQQPAAADKNPTVPSHCCCGPDTVQVMERSNRLETALLRTCVEPTGVEREEKINVFSAHTPTLGRFSLIN